MWKSVLRCCVSLFSAFFQKFHICVQKSVLHCCVTPFHLFPKKNYMYVSRCVLHCCMRKDSCISKKLSFFGGRMLMCENQCCVVASAFSQLFSKNWMYAFETQCCVVASSFCQAQSKLQSNGTPVGADFSLIPRFSNHPTRPPEHSTHRNSRFRQLLAQLVSWNMELLF